MECALQLHSAVVGQILLHLTGTASVALGADPQVLTCGTAKGVVRGNRGPGCSAQDGAQLRLGALCEGRDGERGAHCRAKLGSSVSDLPGPLIKIQGWGTTGYHSYQRAEPQTTSTV